VKRLPPTRPRARLDLTLALLDDDTMMTERTVVSLLRGIDREVAFALEAIAADEVGEATEALAELRLDVTEAANKLWQAT
jgi:hypothetical protein